MTSVLYEDIKLCDSSIDAIKKCNDMASSQKRKEIDTKRRLIMSKIINKTTIRGSQTAHR